LVQDRDRNNTNLGKFGVKPDSKIYIRYCAKSEARLKAFVRESLSTCLRLAASFWVAASLILYGVLLFIVNML